jgi:alpha-N-arabinofuranosidase
MDENCLPEIPLPGLWHDYHYYRSPEDLVAMFNYWDNHDRGDRVLVGEYGCRNDSNPDGVFWSFMQGSCAEAVHMIGLERNSDVVMMAAYAPLLQHFGYTQWSVCTPPLPPWPVKGYALLIVVRNSQHYSASTRAPTA